MKFGPSRGLMRSWGLTKENAQRVKIDSDVLDRYDIDGQAADGATVEVEQPAWWIERIVVERGTAAIVAE